MEAIDKLMEHFKDRFPKGKWDKVGDKIKKRYKEFKSISGGGKKERSKSIGSMTYAARAAIRRIMAYGRGRAETRFGPQAQEAFNRYININNSMKAKINIAKYKYINVHYYDFRIFINYL